MKGPSPSYGVDADTSDLISCMYFVDGGGLVTRARRCDSLVSFELPAKSRGCPAGRFSERAAERTGLGIAETERDIRDRHRSIRQKQLGDLHPALDLVLMCRNSERLLERSTEVMQA
jgi:hypothetical protein